MQIVQYVVAYYRQLVNCSADMPTRLSKSLFDLILSALFYIDSPRFLFFSLDSYRSRVAYMFILTGLLSRFVSCTLYLIMMLIGIPPPKKSLGGLFWGGGYVSIRHVFFGFTEP